MTTKFSWNQCQQFLNMAQLYLGENKSETKLTYALKRVLSRVVKQKATVDERLLDLNIDHCVTAKQGDDEVIVRDGRGDLQYTKDSQKACNTAKLKYLAEANIEVEPHYATKLPDDLGIFELEAFSGFVIKPEDAEAMLVALEEKAGTVAAPAAENGHSAQAAHATA